MATSSEDNYNIKRSEKLREGGSETGRKWVWDLRETTFWRRKVWEGKIYEGEV